jgi:hypothetical protein
MDVSITDFIDASGTVPGSAGAIGVMTEAVPCGPGGQLRACVVNGIYLVSDGDDRLAIMVRPVSRGPRAEVVLQVAAPTAASAEATLDSIRQLALSGSVFRGQVLTFGPELLGLGIGAPLQFLEMNEMEGLGSADDVTFLLTTNQADLLEPALAARPGRVDLAAELPLPSAEARLALIQLYQGQLVLDVTPEGLDDVISRTQGVTAPFLKELLRKAALLSAEDDGADLAAEDSGAGDASSGDGPIRVTDEHLAAALDRLFDEQGTLTRTLLGGAPGGAHERRAVAR